MITVEDVVLFFRFNHKNFVFFRGFEKCHPILITRPRLRHPDRLAVASFLLWFFSSACSSRSKGR